MKLSAQIKTIAAIALLAVCASACGTSGMPDALYGSWDGGNDRVDSVRFSDGGRININNGDCVGQYEIVSVDGNVADIRTGYIECNLMNGYIRGATATINDDSLTIRGPIIGGTYTQ